MCDACSETVDEKSSLCQLWKHGQRCLVLTDWWLEPCRETGKNVWSQFSRTDGEVCALADLWRAWREAAAGEIVSGMTMLTVNADDHPLMGRMHRPDPKRPVEQ